MDLEIHLIPGEIFQKLYQNIFIQYPQPFVFVMKSAPTKVKVITEGAEIYCERRGNGPLLLQIAGAMEDAGFYSSTADILAEKFTVVS